MNSFDVFVIKGFTVGIYHYSLSGNKYFHLLIEGFTTMIGWWDR